MTLCDGKCIAFRGIRISERSVKLVLAIIGYYDLTVFQFLLDLYYRIQIEGDLESEHPYFYVE